jgi:hypothetical protein
MPLPYREPDPGDGCCRALMSPLRAVMHRLTFSKRMNIQDALISVSSRSMGSPGFVEGGALL